VTQERRVRRDALVTASPSVTVAMLADARQVEQGSVRSWLHRHRRAGRIVAVDHDHVVLVPTFQLDDDLGLRDDVAAVTARLSKAGLDSWAAWAWWCGYRTTLEAAPIDVLNAGQHDQLHTAVDRLVDPQG